jgi:hypothetical protein
MLQHALVAEGDGQPLSIQEGLVRAICYACTLKEDEYALVLQTMEETHEEQQDR